jgi:predicted RNA-binding protein Jag
MTPNERRILHLALAGDNTVTTESQGNGENRKVTIRPTK